MKEDPSYWGRGLFWEQLSCMSSKAIEGFVPKPPNLIQALGTIPWHLPKGSSSLTWVACGMFLAWNIEPMVERFEKKLVTGYLQALPFCPSPPKGAQEQNGRASFVKKMLKALCSKELFQNSLYFSIASTGCGVEHQKGNMSKTLLAKKTDLL